MRLKQLLKKIRADAGFTVAEMLVVIVISAALAATAIGVGVGVVNTQRRNTLDRQAEQLFAAASRQMTNICATNRLDTLRLEEVDAGDAYMINGGVLQLSSTRKFAGLNGKYAQGNTDIFKKFYDSVSEDRLVLSADENKYSIYYISKALEGDAGDPQVQEAYELLLNAGSTDPGLLDDDSMFCIFYAVDSTNNYATVLEVWYTRAGFEPGRDDRDYTLAKISASTTTGETARAALREVGSTAKRSQALKACWWGYYGIVDTGASGTASVPVLPAIELADPDVLTCWMEVKNAEELTVTLYCFVPGVEQTGHAMDPKTNSFYEVKVSGANPTTTLSYSLGVNGATSGARGVKSGEYSFKTSECDAFMTDAMREAGYSGYVYKLRDSGGLGDYGCTYALDSLKDKKGFTDFVNGLENQGAIHFMNGEDIRLELNVTCAVNGAQAMQLNDTENDHTAIRAVNSLFASATQKNTYWEVEVAYGRHLQNLDINVSGIALRIGGKECDIKVKQIQSIFFKGLEKSKDKGEINELSYEPERWDEPEEQWWTVYQGNSTFLPINNGYIMSYTYDPESGGGEDKGLAIDDLTVTFENLPARAAAAFNANQEAYKRNAGLFGIFEGESLTGIVFGDPVVKGLNAGALAGTLSNQKGNSVTITDCGVHMIKSDAETDATKAERITAGR